MIESLLLVSAVVTLFVLLVKRMPDLQFLQTKRSGSTRSVVMGLLLFVVVIYLSYAFIIPLLDTWFGFAGVLIGGLLALVVIYFLYAFLVQKTGAKPTL